MFEATARLTVREGELDGFRHQAAELVRQVEAKGTKALRYDWFLSDDGTPGLGAEIQERDEVPA
jgi:hypothetical protein